MLARYTGGMFDTPLPPPLPSGPLPVKRLHVSAVIAWFVVISICLWLVSLSIRRGEHEAAGTAPTTRAVVEAEPKAVDFQTRVSAQYAVGLKTLSPNQSETMAKQVTDSVGPSTEAKVSMAVVLGELKGREAAAEELKRVGGPDAAAFLPIYTAATTAPATLPALGESIHERYGWLARLAETFGQPDSNPQRAAVLADAERTMGIMVGGFGALGVVGVIGLGLLITAILMISQGKLTLRTNPPFGPSHVYIEAFAIYLGGFILVSIALQLIGNTPLIVHVLAQGLFVVIAALWPRVRGATWPQQREDWGVHTGRGVFIEALCGVAGYIAGLPIVAVGLLVTLGLSKLAGVSVSHPIASEGGTPAWQLFFIASVFAPLTEELLFRGALVSHLRGVWGIVMAALISGTIFAAVHPQGWAAIPALASIGASFALIRQWRGSLVPSITAHALNNGVLVGLIVLLS